MGPEYWQDRGHYTIEQTAILAAGGDPCKKLSHQSNKKMISIIDADLRLALISTVTYARELVKKGKVGRYVDKLHDFDIFEHECIEYGVSFYKSIAEENFAALNEKTHPTVDSIKLSVADIRSWLRSEQISSKFFFPNEDSDGQEFKPKTQQQREAVLVSLITKHGKEYLLKLGHPGVWKLLREANEGLFTNNGREYGQSTIKAFFRKQKHLKGFKPSG